MNQMVQTVVKPSDVVITNTYDCVSGWWKGQPFHLDNVWCGCHREALEKENIPHLEGRIWLVQPSDHITPLSCFTYDVGLPWGPKVFCPSPAHVAKALRQWFPMRARRKRSSPTVNSPEARAKETPRRNGMQVMADILAEQRD